MSFKLFKFQLLNRFFIFFTGQFFLKKAGSYSNSCQTSKMQLFAKIVNTFKSLTIFCKKTSVLFMFDGILNKSLNKNEKSLYSVEFVISEITLQDILFTLMVFSSSRSIFSAWNEVQLRYDIEPNQSQNKTMS